MSYTGRYEQQLRENAEELGLNPQVVSLELALQIVQELSTGAIQWGIEDFKQRAIENLNLDDDDESWKQIYDETKFPEALEQMIYHHDCNNGITWDTIDYYLDEYCKK
jgi:hypothetical protein